MSEQPRVKLTYGDFLLFPDDGKRHEIIDGEHYVTASPVTKHQRIVRELLLALANHIRETGAGEVLQSPLDVVLSYTDIVEPDLLYISKARASIIGEKNLQGAPDLLVEVLSPGTRRTDEVVNRKRYEHFAVPEYWIVDPELETVKVYRLEQGRYIRAAVLSREAGDALTTPLLPGLSIPLDAVFG